MDERIENGWMDGCIDGIFSDLFFPGNRGATFRPNGVTYLQTCGLYLSCWRCLYTTDTYNVQSMKKVDFILDKIDMRII